MTISTTKNFSCDCSFAERGSQDGHNGHENAEQIAEYAAALLLIGSYLLAKLLHLFGGRLLGLLQLLVVLLLQLFHVVLELGSLALELLGGRLFVLDESRLFLVKITFLY